MTQTTSTSPAIAADAIDHAAALAPESYARSVRALREKVVIATQAVDDHLFAHASTSLSVHDRLATAQAVAETSGVPALVAAYGERLRAAGGATDGARLNAILDYARTIARDPLAADRSALAALSDAGLSTADIVLLGQLVGYVAYQLRVVAGLQALQALGPAGAASEAVAAAPAEDFVHPANLPPPGEVLRINGFTSETLGWKAWLPVLDPATATPHQQAVLDASHPQARTSDFYLLLAQQPDVLEHRSAAFNAIMYAPGGLPRAERELATAAVSRANGCVYCLSVHAQRFEQLAKRNDVIAQLFQDPDTAGTQPRERAIVRFALVLTRTPGQIGPAHLQALRDAGLTDIQLLDALHASALFAWANRLMLNLGEAVVPGAA